MAAQNGQSGRNGEVPGAATSRAKRARQARPEPDADLLSSDSGAETRERDSIASVRARTTAKRLATAESRDQAADVRDQAAEGARITVGLAELTDCDTLESLLALAGSACGR